MLVEKAKELLTLIADESSSQEKLSAGFGEFFGAAESADDSERSAALRVLAKGLELENAERFRISALVCGALLERGRAIDAGPMIGPLIDRLSRIAPLARRFGEACAALIPQEADDREAQFEKNQKQVGPTMPKEAAAWGLLQALFPPMIAVFSKSPEARQSGLELLEDLHALAEHHQGAFWISKMLRVLHDEPYVAIDLETGIGIEGRMSGISENFQLHLLLMDVFPADGAGKRRVSKAAADMARGLGPQQSDEKITGFWNCYDWMALQGAGAVPRGKWLGAEGFQGHDHWIWNEGTPADIPAFEGRRVILLGPASYPRGWGAMRTFAALAAELTIDKQLSAAEGQALLEKMARAAPAD